ncbi:MAG: YoaK family protein [Angustibacter sp.]
MAGASEAPAASAVPLLLLMTVATGVVDAASYLAMGQLFVTKMTGNLLLLGTSWSTSGLGHLTIAVPVALAMFLCGAAIGGRFTRWLGDHSAKHIAGSNIAVGLLLASASLLTLVTGTDSPRRLGLVLGVLATAMGLQTATARALRVPDLTTTVVSHTLAGLAADSPFGGGRNEHARRRLASVGSILLGGVAGAAVYLLGGAALALAVGAVVTTVVAGLAWRLRRTPDPHPTPRGGSSHVIAAHSVTDLRAARPTRPPARRRAQCDDLPLAVFGCLQQAGRQRERQPFLQ